MISLHSRNITGLTRVMTLSKVMKNKLNDSSCPQCYSKSYKLGTVSKLRYNDRFMYVGNELFLCIHPPNPYNAKVACLMLSLTL